MVGCQKQSTVHKVQAIGHQDLDDRYSLFINNGEFIVDLKSGKIKNDNDEVIGSVLLGHADKKNYWTSLYGRLHQCHYGRISRILS